MKLVLLQHLSAGTEPPCLAWILCLLEFLFLYALIILHCLCTMDNFMELVISFDLYVGLEIELKSLRQVLYPLSRLTGPLYGFFYTILLCYPGWSWAHDCLIPWMGGSLTFIFHVKDLVKILSIWSWALVQCQEKNIFPSIKS